MENLKKLIHIFHNPAIDSLKEWGHCIRGRIIIICILNVIISLISLGTTIATKFLIDSAIVSDMHAIKVCGAVLLSLIIFECLVYVTLSILHSNASAKLQRNMQSMLLREFLVKDYADIKGYHSGELVNRFFSDVAVVRNGLTSIMPETISMAVSFLGAAIILIVMDWRFIILLIVGGFLGLGIVLAFREPMKTRHKRMQEAEDALHASAQEALANIRLIKASTSEKRTFRYIGIRQAGLEAEQIRRGRFSAFMNHGMGLVFDISWFLCMMWGCICISRGSLTYGSLAAIIQLIGRIQGPIANAVTIAGSAYGVVSSAERLHEITGLHSEKQGETLKDFDSIELRDITFQYNDGNEEVLQDISCEIQKGEFVALTGISGGGKSSLFQLLLGIYQPTVGEVLFHLGNKEVHASRGTRGLFAYVPQGNTLFSGTLRDNLVMFTDEVSEQEIQEACRTACIEDLVSEIGYDAAIGERGVGLSEGQAQRVGIARALRSKAPILLLDEATSALDEETEARLLANISEMRDKTCIIVTHRKAALSICDYVMHLENGRMTKERIEND